MSRKMNLLSIGDISKLTGASIRSIRYYEEINILTPAFVDPDTGYRYYSFEQSYYIEMVMFCAFLDIPLKELPSYIGMGETMDYRAFLAHGREIAQEKMKALKNGLKLISCIEKQIELAESYEVGQFYTREIPEKYFVCKPCKSPLNEIDRFDMIMSFSDVPYPDDEESYYMSEHGFLCEHSPSGTSYYAFIEVPKQSATQDIKIIPAGTYFCRQDEDSQIEKAHEIFKENLVGADSYVVIEIEIETSKPKISKPLNELRVIGLPLSYQFILSNSIT